MESGRRRDCGEGVKIEREGLPAGVVEDSQDFGEDAEGDFVGVIGAKVEAEGGAEVMEIGEGEAVSEEIGQDAAHLALAADHAEVGHGAVPQGGGEGGAVDLMVMADEHEGIIVLPGAGGDIIRSGRGDDFPGRKIQELGGPVIHHGDMPAAGAGKGGEGAGTVAGPDEGEGGRRKLGLDEYGDLAPADGTEGIGGGLMKRIGAEEGRGPAGQGEGVGNDEGLEFSASDGAGKAAVRIEQHFAAGLTRDRAAGGSEGDKKMGPPLLPGLEHFGEERAGHAVGDSLKGVEWQEISGGGTGQGIPTSSGEQGSPALKSIKRKTGHPTRVRACNFLVHPEDESMKRTIGILMLLMGLLSAGVLAAGKNSGPFIAIHPEGSQDEGQRMVRPDEQGGETRYYRISPEVSGRHFSGYAPFLSEDGITYGAALYLNDEGTRAVQVMCSTFQGKLARIIVNGRPVDTVRIDRAPRDRRIIIWSGLTPEDFKAFEKSRKLKRVGGESPQQ